MAAGDGEPRRREEAEPGVPARRLVDHGALHRLHLLGRRLCADASLSGVLYAGIVASWQLQCGGPLGPAVGGRSPRAMEASVDRATRRAGCRCLARRTRELLASLGQTPCAVAASLLEAEVRGEPGDLARAPMAVLLSVVVGADRDVKAVTVTAEAVTITRIVHWRREVRVAFPPPVGAFVAGFEAGSFPALVRPS
ncbi:MAG: hypothetical protein ACRDYZ_02580 [Acidimicrobiales bacterium]